MFLQTKSGGDGQRAVWDKGTVVESARLTWTQTRGQQQQQQQQKRCWESSFLPLCMQLNLGPFQLHVWQGHLPPLRLQKWSPAVGLMTCFGVIWNWATTDYNFLDSQSTHFIKQWEMLKCVPLCMWKHGVSIKSWNKSKLVQKCSNTEWSTVEDRVTLAHTCIRPCSQRGVKPLLRSVHFPPYELIRKVCHFITFLTHLALACALSPLACRQPSPWFVYFWLGAMSPLDERVLAQEVRCESCVWPT